MKRTTISGTTALDTLFVDRKKQSILWINLVVVNVSALYYVPNFNSEIPTFNSRWGEPTNDLDIVTLNVLESFLMDFPGCLLVVSTRPVFYG